MELETLQAYWWLIISILGAVLVFLLFVQGGQSMLFCIKDDKHKTLAVNSLGRKWEFTFTTLVVFGGAFFASFPLFYSTSFGGAYWLWMLILVSFVVQAVSYEFRSKKGNIYSSKTYEFFLMFNGLVGCVLLGVVVAMMFFGAEFTIAKGNIVDAQSPIISQWACSHGLEAIGSPRNLLLGIAVFFLARTQGALYLINNVKDSADFAKWMRRRVLINGLIFAVLFVAFVAVLFLAPGYQADAQGEIVKVDNLYFHNLLEMWWLIPLFLIGVVAVLFGVFKAAFVEGWRHGIWFTGLGTVAVVITLFCLAGFNGTAYYPSLLDPASSLTIANSSSSHFTLTTMSIVSLLVPFVLAYIIVVWRKLNNTPLTDEELQEDSHKY